MHKIIIRLFILAVFTILLNFCKPAELQNTATKNFKTSGGNPVIKHPLTADPSIHQWSDGKFYIYGSHDKDNAKYWNMADYHVFSSENMVDWTDHGVVLKKSQTRWIGPFWAPDAAEKDGMFYLYFPEGRHIGVATSTSPTGPFKKPRILYTKMKGRNSANDPCVFEDNGKWYMVFNEDMPTIVTLKDNMLEYEPGSKKVLELDNKGPWHEGPWMHKYNGVYYFSCGGAGDIRYWTSHELFGKYTYRGSIIKSSPPDFPMIKTAHGSTIEVNGQWYLAYHYEVDGYYRRTTCIDSLFYNQDGTIQLVIPTKTGISPVIFSE